MYTAYARGRPRKMYLDQLNDGLNLNTAGTLQLPYVRKSWKTACTFGPHAWFRQWTFMMMMILH